MKPTYGVVLHIIEEKKLFLLSEDNVKDSSANLQMGILSSFYLFSCTEIPNDVANCLLEKSHSPTSMYVHGKGTRIYPKAKEQVLFFYLFTELFPTKTSSCLPVLSESSRLPHLSKNHYVILSSTSE